MKKLYFALLALLLLGCQSPKDQEKIPQSEDSSLRKVIDSPAGMYTYQIYDNKKTLSSGKFVKK